MLEEHGFELSRFTYTWIFFNKYAVGLLYPHICIEVKPTAIVEGRLYALFYCILYEGLEHQWILVSVGSPGTNFLHPGYQG